MKLPQKLAGVFATGTFLLVSLTVYISAMNPGNLMDGVDTALSTPLKILTLALPSALVAGILGFILGSTWSNPKGPAPGSRKKTAGSASSSHRGTGPGLTGNETFLDDIDGVLPEPVLEEDEGA
jgi:hypothetical protein